MVVRKEERRWRGVWWERSGEKDREGWRENDLREICCSQV